MKQKFYCEKCGWGLLYVVNLLTAKCYWGCEHTVCRPCSMVLNRWQHA